MIKLNTPHYCDDCLYFKPRLGSQFFPDEEHLTATAICEHYRICGRIYEYVKKENDNVQSAQESL